MNKVSLGIILPGNPECKQPEKFWLLILEYICKYGWIAFLCITLVYIWREGGIFRAPFDVLMTLVYFTVCFLLISFFWTDKHRCLYCRHFFQLQRISADAVIGRNISDVSRTVYDSHSGVVYNFSGDLDFYSGISSRKEYGKQIKETYTYNKRCNCCGAVVKVKYSKLFREF